VARATRSRVAKLNSSITEDDQKSMTQDAPASAAKTTAKRPVGKWNRQKRRAQHPLPPPKKLTKEERRAKYTARARDRQLHQKTKDLVCYHCREKGHSIQQCPQQQANNNQTNNKSNSKKKKMVATPATAICYKCGSTEHTLASCPKNTKYGDGDAQQHLPFATCFICQEQGHLASSCSQNKHGIFVNGGACKHCGSNRHRGADCPERAKQKRADGTEPGGGRVEEVDVSDLLEEGSNDNAGAELLPSPRTGKKEATSEPADESAKRQAKNVGKKRRVVKF